MLLAQLWMGGTNQIQDAGRGRLVLGTLGEEQQTLARLVSPCGVGMCDLGFLCTKIGVEGVCLERFIAEPEETLRKSKTPARGTNVNTRSIKIRDGMLTESIQGPCSPRCPHCQAQLHQWLPSPLSRRLEQSRWQR